MPYVKLDTGILDSTLWLAESDVRIVFITMLAMAGPSGLCEATAPGIARRANLSLEATRVALSELQAPDDDSRSLAHEGRRVIRVDGGFWIVNYEKYRQRDYTATERKRRQRAQQNAAAAGYRRPAVTDVTPGHRDVTPDVTQAEAEAEAEAVEVSPNGDTSRTTAPDGTAGPTTASSESGNGKPRRPPVPYQKIVELYHEELPELPHVEQLTKRRCGQLSARWREGSLPDLETWQEFFRYVRRSPFLMGFIAPGPNRNKPFVADLEWLTNETNFAKVREGRYHRD